MSRPAGPICLKCSEAMACRKNDVAVELVAEFGSYELWRADVWGCGSCGARVIVGFAEAAIGQHWEPDYQDTLEQERDNIVASVR